MMDVPNDATEEMQADEATDESIQLMDFPNEVLLRMFQHFNDTHLLDMVRVCTRFEAIASETFAKRYNGASDDNYFKIFCNAHGDEPVYLPIFEAFGRRMTALEIVMESTAKFSQNYWLYNFIRDYCASASITHVIVKYANESFNHQHFLDVLPAITHMMFVGPHYNRWVDYRYEHVTHFRAQDFQPIRSSTLQRFVQYNPQIQSLEINGIFMNDPMTALSGQLNSLQELIVKGRGMETMDLTEITFQQLNSLTLSLNHYSAANVLEAIERGSKHISCLDVTFYGEAEQRYEGDWGEAFSAFVKREKAEKTHHFTKLAQVIGTFNQLKSLRLTGLPYVSDFLEILAKYLPKSLNAIHLGVKEINYDFDSNDILLMFGTFEGLQLFSLLNLNLDRHSSGGCSFGLDWCREFAAIGAKRKHAIRCEYNTENWKMLVTKDKCIVNGELRYWTGYEPHQSRSKTHILDLNERCLDKILDWLPDDDVSWVYETCTALKKVAAKRIQSQLHGFAVFDIQKFEDWLNIIEDDIRRLSIWIDEDYPEDHHGSSEILTLVRDRCSKNIIEFKINYGKTKLMDDLNLSFPNLEKLTIDHVVTFDGKFISTLNCPKLTYLEIGSYEINADDGNDEPAIHECHLGISIDNLTVLKLQHFDDVIANLFSTLSDKICLQLTEFTVQNIDSIAQNGNRLINMVCRFRNLKELNFILPPGAIECMNTIFLFERCSKLVKLSLGYGQYGFDKKMQRLLENCKMHCNDLNVIQLVCQSNSIDETIFQFISETFPMVRLYKVMVREADGRRKYKIALWNKSFVPKDCERPY